MKRMLFLSTILSAFAFGGGIAQAAVVLVDPGAAAGTTTVTFDNPTLADGTVITNQYAPLGVTLAGSGQLYASHDYTGTVPGGHAASFSGANAGSSLKTWDFVFDAPVAFAGALFEFNVSTTATFQALLNGNVVESFVYSNNNCCNSPAFLGFSGIGFDTFRLSNVTGSDFYADTLRFSNVSATSVPEPATWAMMLVGFGAIGFTMRRRQKVSTKLNFA